MPKTGHGLAWIGTLDGQWPGFACSLNVISAKLQESGKIYFDDQGDDS